MKKMTPFQAALIGVVTGVVCLGYTLLAKKVGLPISETVQDGLTLGGMTSLLGGVVGARFMPTKDEGSK